MRHSGGACYQHVVELGPFDADEGCDIAPQRFQIGFGEHLSLLVAKAPPAYDRSGFLHRRAHAESVQDAHPVGLHRDPRPHGRPSRVALNELRREASLVERGGQGEPCDSPADDQDAFNVGHPLGPARLGQRPRCYARCTSSIL